VITFTIPGAEELVCSGKKTQTLRLTERRGDICPGDSLGLAVWLGKPRQKGSHREEFMEVICTELVGPFTFHLQHEACPVYIRRGPTLCFGKLSPTEKAELARRDGFGSFAALVEVLRGFYGRHPVELVAIRWLAPRLPRGSASDCREAK